MSLDVAELFPKLDRAMELSRKYLCDREDHPETLAEFEVAVDALRRDPVLVKTTIRDHAEWLHNTGRLDIDGVAKLRATLEPYALGHYERALSILENGFPDPGEEPTKTYEKRLSRLRASLAFARAKGAA